MRFTSDMTDAFRDWLERDQIQGALIAARPELAHSMILDEERPLLRIRYPSGGFLVIAKTAEGAVTQWVVGIPALPEPLIYEPNSHAEIFPTVLGLLDISSGRTVDPAGRVPS